VYHVLEEEFRSQIDDDVWEDQIGVMADVLDAEVISAAVKGMREQKS
jgi:betaine reductase